MTGPTDAVYEAAALAYNQRSRQIVGMHFIADAHLDQRKTFRAAVDAVWAIAYDAGHAAYMQQRRAEIAASLAEPGVADTEQALRARQDAILAEVRGQAHAAGVAEGRRQAAEEIRAAHPRSIGHDSWVSTDDAARIAAGDKP